MKELLKGVLALLGALIVTGLLQPLLFVYSLIYSFWLTVTVKDWARFFVFWYRLIDGFAAALGHALFQLAYALDLTWNVNGEMVEDFVTHEEQTNFSKKNISLSASLGKVSLDGDLNKFGRALSNFLNFSFNQKSHAEDSWNYHVRREALLKKYFQ